MKYYSTQRPVGPGTYPKPKGNFPFEIVNYPDRTYVPEIKRMAWGEIVYLSPLSEEDTDEYELVPAPIETKGEPK